MKPAKGPTKKIIKPTTKVSNTTSVGELVEVDFPHKSGRINKIGTVTHTDRKKGGKRYNLRVEFPDGSEVFCDEKHVKSIGGQTTKPQKTSPVAPSISPPKMAKQPPFNVTSLPTSLRIEECVRCNNGDLYVPYSKTVYKDNVFNMVYPDYVKGVEHFILVPAESKVSHIPEGHKRKVEICSRCSGGHLATVEAIAKGYTPMINAKRLVKKGIVAIIKVYPRKR